MSDLSPEELKQYEDWADEINQEFLHYWLTDDWYPEIRWFRGGQEQYWEGGPVHQSGWFVIPYCGTSCCRPKGPFTTYSEAQRYHRIRLFKDGGHFPLAAWNHA